MMREFFDREKLFNAFASEKTFKETLTRIVGYSALFLAVYGLIFGFFANKNSLEWAFIDLIKFPATFLLAIVFSLPAVHVIAMIAGCKGGLKHTFAIMLSSTMLMSILTLALGGVLILLLGINKASYDILQITNVLVIGLSALISSFYVFTGFKITHGLNDSGAMILLLICGVIWLVMLPQVTGLIGPYSTGTYSLPTLKGLSGIWGTMEATKALR